MTPGRYDITLYQGDTYEWRFELWDDEEKTLPTDLSTVTPHAQIRSAPGAAIAADLICAVDPTGDGNAIDMSLPENLWETLSTITKGQWDLELRYAGGQVHTVLGGTVTITADITKVTAGP